MCNMTFPGNNGMAGMYTSVFFPSVRHIHVHTYTLSTIYVDELKIISNVLCWYTIVCRVYVNTLSTFFLWDFFPCSELLESGCCFASCALILVLLR